MSAILPTVPRVVLCYLEPISLYVAQAITRLRTNDHPSSLLGTIVPVVLPEFFIPSQLPTGHLVASQTTASGAFNILPTERVLAYQCANLYLLLAMVGVGVLNTTTEPKVVHAYVWALWVADVGHFGATGYVMGMDGLLRWQDWNATMWGNLGAVIVLFTVRSLYLLGFLGEDRIPPEEEARRYGSKAKAG